jgi:hypothetical protein
MTEQARHKDKYPQSRIPLTALARPGCLAGWRLRDNAACGAQRGAPLMTGALMSARNDMEAAEPKLGHLREGVELMRVHHVASFEVRPLSDAGLRSTGGVA